MRAGLSFGGMSSASEPVLSSSEESADEFDTSDDSSSEDNEKVSSTTRPTPRAPRKADDDSDVDKKFKFPTHTDVFAYDEALKKLKEITSVTVSEAAALEKHTAHLHLLSPSTSLHPHQVVALKWLANLWDKECGGIVGDLMGLGKTLEAISLIAYALGEAKATGPFLVVCPLSVVMNWMAEFHRFAPKIRVQKYHGTKDERSGVQDKIRDHVMKQPKEQRKDPSFDFDVMVTNYETVLSDVEFLGRFRWRLAVIDEAHRLKNYHSRTFQTLKLQYAITRCVLLTGTPIQNNLAELYALLALAVPAIFPIGAADSFVRQFKAATDKDATKAGKVLKDGDLTVNQLQALLAPILLRRTLADVGVDLPPLTETVIQCPMTLMQKHWYLSVLEGHVAQLVAASSGGRSSTLGLQNILMQLRKVCNHPYLFPGAEPEPFEEGDHIFQNSGKAWILDRLLLRLRSEGHKVLLFSQSTHMLDILQDYMAYRGWNYERLDGSVRSEERWTSVQRFQRSTSVISANSMAKDDDAFVFLLSTRAGGVGLNLTNADTVILYDSDWNPQADLQAIGRAHRIGQTKPVRVIRLMTVNSVEEVILRRALLKLQLTKQVMAGGVLTGVADRADDEDPMQPTDSTSLLRMIQFGLSKLTSEDPVELSNKLVDAALASASDSVDVIDVSGSVSLTSVKKPAVPLASPTEPEEPEATVSLVDIEAAASQLQNSLYGYEGKEYNPTARVDEDAAVMSLITAGTSDVDAAAVSALAARHVAESTRIKPVPRPAAVQSPKPRKPRQPKRPQTSSSASESEVSSDEDKKAKVKKPRVVTKPSPKDVDYVSNLLPSPDASSLVVDDDKTMAFGLEYVIGDATQPSANTTRQLSNKDGEPLTTQDTTAITLHCVDTSGRWGSGGMFTAINNLDGGIGKAYERAGRNHDLHLGDTHLIGVHNNPFSAWQGRQFIALLVVLDRDAVGQLVLDSAALKIALDRLAGWMMEPGSSCDGIDVASVHTPRIGARMPCISWYSVEHTLQRYLCQRGIRTVVYYFQRLGGGSVTPPHHRIGSPWSPRPSTPVASPKPSPPHEPPSHSRLKHWLQQGAENTALAKACPDWRDNVQFVFSQSKEAVQSALDSLTAELQSTTDAGKRVFLEFFANVMSDVLGEEKK